MSALQAPATADPKLVALNNANTIRLARVGVRQRIRQSRDQHASAVAAATELENDTGVLDTMPAWEFVALVWRVQPARWAGWLAAGDIPHGKHLGTLTSRQRGVLIDRLRAYGRAR